MDILFYLTWLSFCYLLPLIQLCFHFCWGYSSFFLLFYRILFYFILSKRLMLILIYAPWNKYVSNTHFVSVSWVHILFSLCYRIFLSGIWGLTLSAGSVPTSGPLTLPFMPWARSVKCSHAPCGNPIMMSAFPFCLPQLCYLQTASRVTSASEGGEGGRIFLQPG